MTDWTQVLVALAVGLPATITAAGAVYISWLNLKKGKENSAKIDDNTALTRAGASAAVSNAKVAASAANNAATKADELAKQMNGALDERIKSIVKEHFDPLKEAVTAHAQQDERNMAEVRDALQKLVGDK